jgi:acyl carrier protein
MKEIYDKLAEILEVETVAPGDVLREFGAWDSLAALSIIAMMESTYGVQATAQDLKTIQTAGELERFIVDRKSGGRG